MTPQAKHEFDLFLSYSRDDEASVITVQQALEKNGLLVWRDNNRILAGDPFIQDLQEGLECSRCVVLFWSARAMASEWVQREWNIALTLNRKIIPVRLDDTEMPLILRPVQFVDFRESGRLARAVSEITSGLNGGASGVTADTIAADTLSTNSDTQSNPSVLGVDATILQRMIERQQRTGASLRTVRVAELLSSVALVIAAVVFAPAEWGLVLSGAILLVAGVFAWTLTAQLTAHQTEAMRLTSLKEGIELYCPRQPACVEFRLRLETILKQGAGIQGGVR